jgi:hypothetical protein
MPQTVIGLLIIVWGLALLASNFGWIEPYFVRRLIGFWPLVIVAIGVAKILSARSPSDRVVGGVIAFIGCWFLFGFRQFFPLLLVGLGALLIARAQRRGSPGPAADDAGSEFAVWSGIERRVAGVFRGANLTAIMGGIEIDLREAVTVSGEAVVDVFVIMGGVEITVPPDWRVVNQVTPILGGVEDRSTGLADAPHRLVVRGTTIMGGVEIKTR